MSRAGASRRFRGGAAAALLLALAVACGREDSPAPIPPPIAIRGGVVVEPPELAIGETATVEIAVMTPPDHRLEPFEGPGAVEGLWILGVEQPPPERTPGRWIHRVRFRVRSRTTGELLWPAAIAFVGRPDGERIPVSLAERPLRVIETSGELSEQREPFSYRVPREPGRADGFLLPAFVGGVSVLAALALAGLVRRTRAARRAAEGEPEAPREEAPETAADLALTAALAELERDPVTAAGAASAALRLYVARRTGAPAPAATTEELSELVPPFVLARTWPDILALLRALDLARFRAGALAGPEARRDLEGSLRAARALVAAAPRPPPA